MDTDVVIAVLREGDLDKFSELDRNLLLDTETYDFVKDFISEYGVFPSEKTVYDELDIPEVESIEPLKFYEDKLEERRKLNKIKEILNQGTKTLKKDITIDEGVDEIKHLLIALECNREDTGFIDITKNANDRYNDYLERKSKSGLLGVSSPWEQLDEMIGGWCEGNIVVIVGPTEIGKTWFLVKQFEHSIKKGDIPLFISVELIAKTVAMRFDSVYSSVDYSNLRRGKLDSFSEEEYKNKMEELNSSDFKGYVMDASKASTPDQIDYSINSLTPRPNVILLDGLYLLQDEMKRSKRAHWEKITKIIRNLQLIASKNSIPIVATSQFNKKVKKGSSKGDVGDIGYSHSIAQAADVCIALKQDLYAMENDEMDMEIIKGREFKKSAKGITVNWKVPHDFSFISLHEEFAIEDDAPEPKASVEDEDEDAFPW